MRGPFPIAALFALCFIGGCLDSKSPTEEEIPSPTPPAPVVEPEKLYIVATDVSTPSSEGVFRLRPAGTTTFQKGATVNLTFKNAVGNQYVHDLVLEGYDIRIEGVKDMAQTVVFNATKTGTFAFYCDRTLNVGPSPGLVEHRALGMEGAITVQ